MIVHILHKRDDATTYPVFTLCTTVEREKWRDPNITACCRIKSINTYTKVPNCEVCILLALEEPENVRVVE